MEDNTSEETATDFTIDRMTKDEEALYDRQIRLWGLDVQKKLRETSVLIVGLNGLGVEIAKNLALSGVESITLVDKSPVTEKDTSAQFFAAYAEPGLTRARASQAALRELNPNVIIAVGADDELEKKYKTYVKNFSVVFVTDSPLGLSMNLNKACRNQGISFYCGATWGFYGYGFADLNEYTYLNNRPDPVDNKVVKTKKIDYTSLGGCLGATVGQGLRKRVSSVYPLIRIMNTFAELIGRLPKPNSEDDLALLKKCRDESLKLMEFDSNKVSDEMLMCCFGELSPVCAAVGGVIANEMIREISNTSEPLNNFFLFDGETCTGHVEKVFVKDF